MTLYAPSSIIALFVIFPIIGLLVLGLRFHVRLHVQKPPELWIDDWLILVGAILTVSLNVNGIIGWLPLADAGVNTEDCKRADDESDKVVYPQDVIEKVAYGLVKLSILFFYRRIFRVDSFRRVNNVIIAFVASWAITYFFVTLFECGVHPAVLWAGSKAAQDATCIDTSHLLLSFAITDVITDFLVLVLPIREVWRLQMEIKKKYAVTGIFVLGALSTAAGIVRLGLVVKASRGVFLEWPWMN
ncbi:MAG: hypothetical protein M1822_006523 [Bathelium mastoideum]|nr:MAG: hypothetical protein M1822_006523 [Bathelium mastoideum]